MLTDPRIKKLAKLLTHYSVGLREGDLFVIRATPVAAPLVQECYREALLLGAHPHVDLRLPGLDEVFYRTASDAELGYISPITRYYMEKFDAQLSILSDVNTKALSGIDPARMARAQGARRELMQTFMERDANDSLRWSVAMYPTDAYAQDAELSVDGLADFILGACLVDEDDPVAAWRAVAARQQGWIDRLAGKREVRLVGPDTDLTFSIAGRIFINDDGTKNMPGGEIFTGPVEDSANGTIRYTYPAVYGGKEVADVYLRFEAGRVVEAHAGKNDELLQSLLGMDEGATRLGEFAFGTNPGVTRFTRNVLFDEKIAGTVHLALGSGYPATGSTNQSALHWDMVCDLRQGGEIYVDGQLFAKDGQFVD
jgi:aminopeptidase